MYTCSVGKQEFVPANQGTGQSVKTRLHILIFQPRKFTYVMFCRNNFNKCHLSTIYCHHHLRTARCICIYIYIYMITFNLPWEPIFTNEGAIRQRFLRYIHLFLLVLRKVFTNEWIPLFGQSIYYSTPDTLFNGQQNIHCQENRRWFSTWPRSV